MYTAEARKLSMSAEQRERRPTIKPEFSGMVWCPIKKSGIAMMRCGEYQEQLGCGRSCRMKAPKEQLSEIRELLKQRIKEPYFSKGDQEGRYTCPACGGRKKSVEGRVCRPCAGSMQRRRGRPSESAMKG